MRAATRINQILVRTQAILDRVSDLTGQTVCWLCLAMMLVTFVVVVMRHLFNIGFIAVQESVMFMHGTMFMLGIAFTLRHDGHVRVDILYQRFSPKVRAGVNIAGTIFFLLPFAIFVTWVSLEFVSFSWALTESSAEPGGLPGVFLLKTMIPAMSIAVAVQGGSEIIRNLQVLLKPPS